MPHNPDKTPNIGSKKVLFVVTKASFGGAQRYVYELATNLGAGFTPVVVVGGEGPLQTKLEAAHVRTISIRSMQRDVSLLKEVQSFLALMRIIRTERPDVLHLNSPKAGGLGGLAGRIMGVPRIIYTGHGWATNERRPWWQKKVIAIAQWATIMLSHITIAVSQKTAADIAQLPLVRKKVVVIYNGVPSIDFLSHEHARLKLASQFPFLLKHLDKKWVGMHAELHPNKGIDLVIDALAPLMQKNSNCIALVVGSGELKERLAKHIAQIGARDSFFLLGYIEDARIYLKAYDVFVMPSRTEALPYALIEAGLAGLPVVASAVGGIPEIVKNEVSGLLVDPANQAQLRSGVVTLLTDRAKAAVYGHELSEYSHKTFSFEEMVTRTKNLYQGQSVAPTPTSSVLNDTRRADRP